MKKKNKLYVLKDINNSCLFISSCKYDVVTEKIKLLSHYREYKVPYLSKYLKIIKREKKVGALNCLC